MRSKDATGFYSKYGRPGLTLSFEDKVYIEMTIMEDELDGYIDEIEEELAPAVKPIKPSPIVEEQAPVVVPPVFVPTSAANIRALG